MKKPQDGDAVVIPCAHRFPISQCEHMKGVVGDTSMTYEHYACDVCGKRESLDYEEMR